MLEKGALACFFFFFLLLYGEDDKVLGNECVKQGLFIKCLDFTFFKYRFYQY